MNIHTCLLCLGSNLNGSARLEDARHALCLHFADIRFGEVMVTEAIGSGFLSPFHNQLARLHTSLRAEEVRSVLKEIERKCGRLPEDKAQGIVRLDIDLLTFDELVLKPGDMEREFVRKGLSKEFHHG